MIRSELVARLQQQNPQLYLRDCEAIVSAILATMSDALAAGGRVEIRGFGSFTVKERGPRPGRNPRSGAPVAVKAKRFVYFKAGKEMKDRLNPQEAKEPEQIVARMLGRG